MKKAIGLYVVLAMYTSVWGQGVGVGTDSPDASAALDISSTSKGMLVPRLSSTQRELIISPAQGLLVFDVTTESFWFHNTTTWIELVDKVNTEVHRTNPDQIYLGLTDSVGIGTMNPDVKLQVKTSGGQYGISHTNGQVDVATYVSNTLGGWIGTRSDHPFNLFAGDGANQFTLIPNGHIGLGTSSPIEKLHVVGNAYFNGNILINGAPDNRLDIVHDVPRQGLHPEDRAMYVTGDFGASSGGVEFRHANSTQGIGFGFNTIYAAGSNTNQDLGIATKGTGTLFLKTNDLTRLFISGDGKTGLGTTNPSATLDVIRGTGFEGTTRFQGSTHHSHFNYSTTEHTFIRGGKAGSHVVLNDLAGQGNVGVGTGNPVQKLHVAGKVFVRDSIGIGISTPNAPLQFGNGIQNRKLVLFDSFNNDHQYYGLGINTAILRYQVAGTDKSHAFYAATSGTASSELMRIQGNGNVGVGIITPYNRMDIHTGSGRTGIHSSGLALYVTGEMGESSGGVEFRHSNGSQGIGFGHNTIYTTGSNVQQDLKMVASGKLIFKTGAFEALRIEQGGQVSVPGALNIGYEQVWSDTIIVPANGNVTWECSCPPGKKVISGGYSQGGNVIRVSGSYAINDSTWWYNLTNEANGPTTFSGFVICARLGN